MAQLGGWLTPDAAEPPLLIAELFQSEDRPDAALRTLDRANLTGAAALQRDLAKARALNDVGRVDDAEAVLRGAIAAHPDRLEPQIALGDHLRRSERFAAAAEVYTDAIDRLRDAGRSVPWRLLYVRGIAHERSDRWDLAERDFLAALEVDPDLPQVLNYLGYSWVERRIRLDEATRMLRRAVDLRPDDGFIVDSLGWAYFQLGEFEEAVTHLERAVELQPADPVLNDHLGDAYWRVGRAREARFQWSRVLVFEPTPELAAAVREKLQRGLDQL
jgi:Flp pilus assembly protein TadD